MDDEITREINNKRIVSKNNNLEIDQRNFSFDLTREEIIKIDQNNQNKLKLKSKKLFNMKEKKLDKTDNNQEQLNIKSNKILEIKNNNHYEEKDFDGKKNIYKCIKCGKKCNRILEESDDVYMCSKCSKELKKIYNLIRRNK